MPVDGRLLAYAGALGFDVVFFNNTAMAYSLFSKGTCRKIGAVSVADFRTRREMLAFLRGVRFQRLRDQELAPGRTHG